VLLTPRELGFVSCMPLIRAWTHRASQYVCTDRLVRQNRVRRDRTLTLPRPGAVENDGQAAGVEERGRPHLYRWIHIDRVFVHGEQNIHAGRRSLVAPAKRPVISRVSNSSQCQKHPLLTAQWSDYASWSPLACIIDPP